MYINEVAGGTEKTCREEPGEKATENAYSEKWGPEEAAIMAVKEWGLQQNGGKADGEVDLELSLPNGLFP